MRNQRLFSSILVAGLFLVLGCQIADLFASAPTPVSPTQPPIARNTAEPPVVRNTTVPPTPVPIVPTAVAVLPSPTTQVEVAPTRPPASPTAPLPPGCTNPNATITSLTDNGTVSGLIEIIGTATRTDMQYWKIEYRREANTNYDILNNSDKAITDGVLARLSTKTLANGIYFIRLVIVQKDGNFSTPCEFRINFAN